MEESRLGSCEVCAKVAARYTCPRCEVKTCSLDCVNIHKKELNCDGIRNRTKFIPLKEMSELDFRNDYYLLEECAHYVNARKTDRIKSFTHHRRGLPSHLNRLRREAQTLSINLRYLLPNFTRHKENTTYFNRSQKKLYWHIKWCFMGDSGSMPDAVYCCVDKRTDGEQLLETLLNKHLQSTKQVKSLKKYRNSNVKQDLKVFLLAEGVKRCGNRYYPCCVEKSVNENLTKKTIVEYPCFYISLTSEEQQWRNLHLIDSDENLEEEVNEYYQQLNDMRKVFLEKYGFAPPKHDKADAIEKKNEENSPIKHVKKTEEELMADVEEENGNMEDFPEKHNSNENIIQVIKSKHKGEEYYQTTNNFLFMDDKVIDALSSSEEEDNR